MTTTEQKALRNRHSQRLYLSTDAGDAARFVAAAVGPLSAFNNSWVPKYAQAEQAEAQALAAEAQALAAKLRDLHRRLGGTWSFE